MCRFVAYTGRPVFLESLLVKPEASLIAQSLAARESKMMVNGDGCGVGWYGELEEPCVYRGVLPAWSDCNLASLCRQIRSRLFLAHVRSATSGEVTTANCHPFTAGRHLFMHNGQIGDYDRLRRNIDGLISDEIYARRRGTGDSEVIFLAALSRGLETDPVLAFKTTLADIMRQGARKALRFAAVYTDGETVWAFRWASDDRPPSLYYQKTDDGVVVASEPFDEGTWSEIPHDAVIRFDANGLIDQKSFNPKEKRPGALPLDPTKGIAFGNPMAAQAS